MQPHEETSQGTYHLAIRALLAGEMGLCAAH